MSTPYLAGNAPADKTPRSSSLISVVAPVFNEEGNVGLLVERISEVLKTLGSNWEIVLVDDGSKDQTWSRISEVCKQQPNVKALRLSRNFGHQSALLAGLHHSSGNPIISMDGDLQHPPEVIPELYAAWQAGNRIVNTKRQDKEVFGPFKRVSSKLFYQAFSFLTQIHVREGSSDFRLLDRSALEEVLAFGDIDLFLRGAVEWIGFSSTTVNYTAAPRTSGESKYNLRRMLKFASGAIISFSDVPLKVGVWLGLFTALLACLELLYVIWATLAGHTVPGWASAVGLTSLLFAVTFICLGLIGIYVGRIYRVLQNRPRFIVAERQQSGTIPPPHSND